MLTHYLFIGLGGGLGAITRVAITRLLPFADPSQFPLKILLVNAMGCFLMGLLAETLSLVWSPSEDIRAFLAPGFLGGFTTFSAFALEFGLLCDRNLTGWAFAYVVTSVTLCLICFMIGLKLIRFVTP
jgi:CrcB protein